MIPLKKSTALAVMTLFVMTMISCGKKVPLNDDQKLFAGRWVAADGTFVHIYLNGGADLKTSNTSVTGGSIAFTGTAVTIGLGPIKKTMEMTQKPTQAGGKWVMKLDGIEYVKQ